MRSSGRDHGSFLPLTPTRRMEDVWRSITMSNSNQLHHQYREVPPIAIPPSPLSFHHLTTEPTSSAFRGIILQDFLAGASAESSSPPLPPPPTSLNLNTAPHHHSDSSSDTSRAHPWAGGGDRLFFSTDAGSPTAVRTYKRAVEEQLHERFGGGSRDTDDAGDRHQKRMMKNRESAARSRARKQAYTNDLEIEVARLAKENGKLRKQYEELRIAMDAHAFCTKRKLQRSSTTLF